MFGYVYMTTNTINEKRYIGKHRKSYFDEKYLGSGKHLKSAVKKYGKENFIVELIKWSSSNEELANDEADFIQQFQPEYNIWYMPQEYSDNSYHWEKGQIPVNKGTHLTNEQKKYISEQTKKAMARPEIKKKSMKGSLKMKEQKQRELQSRIQKERFKNPEARKYVSIQTKLAVARPDVKKKNKENTKKAMWTPKIRLNYLEGRQKWLITKNKNLSQKLLNELYILRKEVRLTDES